MGGRPMYPHPTSLSSSVRGGLTRPSRTTLSLAHAPVGFQPSSIHMKETRAAHNHHTDETPSPGIHRSCSTARQLVHLSTDHAAGQLVERIAWPSATPRAPSCAPWESAEHLSDTRSRAGAGRGPPGTLPSQSRHRHGTDDTLRSQGRPSLPRWPMTRPSHCARHGQPGSSDPRRRLGRLGEDLAAAHLQRLGYAMLARNVRTRHGEIDLIAHRAGVLVFAEVKTARARSQNAPARGPALGRWSGCTRASALACEDSPRVAGRAHETPGAGRRDPLRRGRRDRRCPRPPAAP